MNDIEERELEAELPDHIFIVGRGGVPRVFALKNGNQIANACATRVADGQWVATRCVDDCWVAVGERESGSAALKLALSEDFDIESLKTTVPELLGHVLRLEHRVTELEEAVQTALARLRTFGGL